jgi:hypothetical protein
MELGRLINAETDLEINKTGTRHRPYCEFLIKNEIEQRCYHYNCTYLGRTKWYINTLPPREKDNREESKVEMRKASPKTHIINQRVQLNQFSST